MFKIFSLGAKIRDSAPLKLGNRLSAPPPKKKNVARTPMVRCPFHQASALEVNGPPNLNVVPTPLISQANCKAGKLNL